MSLKTKIIAGAAVAAVAAAAIAAFVWLAPVLRGGDGAMAFLPRPDGTSPYILLEANSRSYPKRLASLLTEGLYAHIKSGTPRGAVLAAASAAEDAALLIESGEGGALAVYCAARFSESDTKLLQKGELPAALASALGASKAEAQDGIFTLRSESISGPLYYTVDGKNTLIAASASALRKMAAIKKSESGLKDKKWTQEPQWPAHIEICDGGALAARAQKNLTLTVEAAWHGQEEGGPSGEARWALVNLDAAARTYLSSALKAKQWNVADYVLPQPLLLSCGANLPALKGEPEEWPFPLSAVGELAENLGMSAAQISEILAGRTVFSLGGQNKILWFSLPGFLLEISGKPDVMRGLVSSFWANMFPGAEPSPIDGFEYGGGASVPFSVIGAGRGGTAALGLASPQSLVSGEALSPFLGKDEEAVGWLLADLPRIGKALSEMTRMSSFLEEEEDEDFYGDEPIGGSGAYMWGGAPETDPEPLQPEISISPFDQEIADSFGSVLRKLGRLMVVWEKPLSGRINWYNQEK